MGALDRPVREKAGRAISHNRQHGATNKPPWVQFVGIQRKEGATLDVREGPRFTPDNEGFEFNSLDAAKYEPARAAAEIGREDLPNGKASEVTVEVRDEHGQPVLTVAVAMMVRRMDPALRHMYR
jgi:hypothetical protein